MYHDCSGELQLHQLNCMLSIQNWLSCSKFALNNVQQHSFKRIHTLKPSSITNSNNGTKNNCLQINKKLSYYYTNSAP